MVRLILHGSGGESSIQFGTRDGGMSITGDSRRLQFEAGDEKLLTIEADGSGAPFAECDVVFRLKGDETQAQFTQAGIAYAAATQVAGGTTKLQLYTHDADPQLVMIREAYADLAGLLTSIQLSQKPEHALWASLGDFSAATAYVIGPSPPEFEQVLDFFRQEGTSVVYVSTGVDTAGYTFVGGHPAP